MNQVIAAEGETLSRGVRAQTLHAVIPDTGEAFIRPKHLAAALGVGPSTVWRYVTEKRLPDPDKLSEGVTGWWASTLRSWLKGQREAA